MRVLVWPADDGGCGHYRCTWPAEALAAQGADVELVPANAWGPCNVLMQDETVGGRTFPRAIALSGTVDADVVVIQRPLSAHRADLVELLQAQGVRVVVEIDDCFETIHPRNVSYTSTHPRRSPGANRVHVARACRAADLVTVTTPMLARRYGGHGRCVVVPNMVPAAYLDIDAGDRPLTIGWTGSLGTHPTDLQVTRGAVARVCQSAEVSASRPPVPFAVVGTGQGVQAALGLAVPPVASGWLSLDDYPVAMAEHGVGIVPLDDIAFNSAKSALKMMEYAALGVPVVASPTPDNVRMHAAGVGLLAAKPKDWTRHLRDLVASAGYREHIAHAGRAEMSEFTIEGNADRWHDAWTSPVRERTAA